MKKIISIVLAVMLVVSVAAVAAGAYGNKDDYTKMTPAGKYKPSDSYTVDENTPYGEDAVVACGGSLDDTQKIYFQAPADWANKFNTFPGPDLPDNEPYMHVCAYWWSGIGSDWTSAGGGTVKWCGYQAHLVDKENRIYCITMPNDGGSPALTINNGVNAGMDQSAEIFTYGRQLQDLNTEGAWEGDFDSLPEGSPTQDDFDGCIAIIDYTNEQPNALTGFPNYGSNWYVYYGQGCYGEYAKTSENFKGQIEECKNPEHFDGEGKHIDIELPHEPGDVDGDDIVDTNDVIAIQKYLAHMIELSQFEMEAADVDGDGYVSIIDATRIQRWMAGLVEDLTASAPATPERPAPTPNA